MADQVTNPVAGQVWRSRKRWSGPVIYVRVLGLIGSHVALTPVNGASKYAMPMPVFLEEFEPTEGTEQGGDEQSGG
jgi:hypothetical protein